MSVTDYRWLGVWCAVAPIAASPAVTSAHGDRGLASTAVTQWTAEPVTIALLAASAVLHGAGLRVLWRRAGRWRGATVLRSIAFCAGLLSIAAALLSPLAWLSEVMFSAHMTQHEILMLISAPFSSCHVRSWSSCGRSPPGGRSRTRSLVSGRRIGATWHWLTGPLAAFVLHGAALWIWHIPTLRLSIGIDGR